MIEKLPVSNDIAKAHMRLKKWLIPTPVLESEILNERANSRVLIKAESLQYTGTFKIRGALNRLLQLSQQQLSLGVVAFSSGNHAQGVAMAAKWLGIKATIVMPKDSPQIKQNNTRILGAKVILYDRFKEDREDIAKKISQKTGSVVIPSFDHSDIISGQGTVGLETAQYAQAAGLKLDALCCPCGGGGLIAGCSLSIKTVFKECQIFSVEPEAYDDTKRSLKANERLLVRGHPSTICDALMSPTPGVLTFEINRKALAGGYTVTDEQAAHAVAFAARYLKLVLEPSGAVALATVLEGRMKSFDTVAIILSGANIDHMDYLKILEDYPEP
ncbi:MAG: pyridoxal-5'-phosphate-dependent protein [Rhodospirillaceae bacterium]|nr:pyridoxal-5'-phosphate-dependent protein [Rhodospirillaceae bacterium]|tara:strand:- start:405 stop:1394 length:990 start_codon:yes stop_codon:yes gene_type:complete